MDQVDLTVCPVCLGTYNTTEACPRILPCLHTLCESCLKNLFEVGNDVENGVRCPECRTVHETNTDGKLPVQQNRYILQFLDFLSKQKDSNCKIHNRALTLYCETEKCHEAVCNLCFFKGDHKGHSVSDLEEKAENRKKDVIQEIEVLENKCSKYRGHITETVRNVTSSKDKCVSYVKNIHEDLKSIMDDHLKSFRTSVKSRYDNDIKELKIIERQYGSRISLAKRLKMKLGDAKPLEVLRNPVYKRQALQRALTTSSEMNRAKMSTYEVGGVDDMGLLRQKLSDILDTCCTMSEASYSLRKEPELDHCFGDEETSSEEEYSDMAGEPIFVHMYGGPVEKQKFCVDISPSRTVRCLKRRLFQKTGIPVKRQRIYFGLKGKLSNNSILNEVGVRRDSTLILDPTNS